MSSVRTAALAAFVATASLWGALAQAQVYRIVGPDGKVTFSDRPPAEGRAAPGASGNAPANAPATGGNLPTEVRNAAARYPVTLYTGADCNPCANARALLQRRGVPFVEKTIVTEDDVAALERLSGSNSLPFATVGGQHLKGFSDAEWSQYLDAAGYPKTSQLPPSYRNPPATPLVAAQRPAVRAEAAPAQGGTEFQPRTRGGDAPAAAPAERPDAGNPAGIRF